MRSEQNEVLRLLMANLVTFTFFFLAVSRSSLTHCRISIIRNSRHLFPLISLPWLFVLRLSLLKRKKQLF